MKGILTLPNDSRWLILFIKGKETELYNLRIQYISEYLNKDGISTLILDLYNSKEKNNISSQFKIDADLLAQAVTYLTDWLIDYEYTKNKLIGYFGLNIGSMSALIAGNQRPNSVSVIVCGGRIPNLNSNHSFMDITCPILIIADEKDTQVTDSSQQYLEELLPNAKKKKLITLLNVNSLFDERAKLDEVAKKASGWFRCYFQIKENDV
ncbi:MAG TPA: hypothetical protein VN704_08360 [Verrucomicrobiae bacterium]|nr:hypothetical protein [Verrucomicrobiae bacterium]